MPILHIKALPQDNPESITSALKKTALAISEIYGCDPENVWCTWQ
jgi:phenylpyruvate tautomerase PptA (4-oxalocrotonate tautomerase family)